MTDGDAGVGATGRLTKGDHRYGTILVGRMAEAGGGGWIEEAVGENAGMEGAGAVAGDFDVSPTEGIVVGGGMGTRGGNRPPTASSKSDRAFQ